MKRILIAMMITLIAATAANASDVGVSVSIGQPGFYLNIGNFPPPVVYAHPVVVRPAPVIVARPVYVSRAPRPCEAMAAISLRSSRLLSA